MVKKHHDFPETGRALFFFFLLRSLYQKDQSAKGDDGKNHSFIKGVLYVFGNRRIGSIRKHGKAQFVKGNAGKHKDLGAAPVGFSVDMRNIFLSFMDLYFS